LRVEIDCYSLFDVESFLSYFVIQDFTYQSDYLELEFFCWMAVCLTE